LIKVGQKDHIHSLQNDGLLFMNPVKYFQQVEDNSLRGDKEEGIGSLHQINNLSILHEGKEIARSHKSSQLRLYDNELQGTIYSMVSVSSLDHLPVVGERQPINLDSRVADFGKHSLIIFNPGEFIRRVISTAEKRKLDVEYGFVKYYDPKNYDGKLSIFHKAKTFEHQKEFRFYVKKKSFRPRILRVGNISDISTLFPITKLISNLEIEVL